MIMLRLLEVNNEFNKLNLVSQMTMIYSNNMDYILARIGFTILILRNKYPEWTKVSAYLDMYLP